jgi:hypothetical protein
LGLMVFAHFIGSGGLRFAPALNCLFSIPTNFHFTFYPHTGIARWSK